MLVVFTFHENRPLKLYSELQSSWQNAHNEIIHQDLEHMLGMNTPFTSICWIFRFVSARSRFVTGWMRWICLFVAVVVQLYQFSRAESPLQSINCAV